MSQRFPRLEPQVDLATTHRQQAGPVQVVALSFIQATSLPWFEILLGAAFLMAMRAI